MQVKVSPKNKVIRESHKASYDTETIHKIIDSGSLCHVGFIDNGTPVVIPMLHWRVGDKLYMHAARNGRFARCCIDQEICVSIAHMDGYVLARSAFNHSINYRSIVIHGTAGSVNDPDARLLLLKQFMEQLFPGRWDTLRPVKANEMKATEIIELPIETVAAKQRSGGPGDVDEEPDSDVWAGVLPVLQGFGTPKVDSESTVEAVLPDYLNKS